MIMGKRRIVSMADYGVIPDSSENFASAFNKFAEADTAKCAAIYRFVKGTYRGYASCGIKKTSDGLKRNNRTLMISVSDKKNLIIDGDGSKLIFYGHCTPFHFENCENVTLKNFVIDWEQPMTAEGKVVGKCADYIDLEIDTALFPCYVKDYCLYFDIGDGESYPLTYGLHTVYDPSTLTVAPNSADHIMVSSAERIGENIFRIYLSGLLPSNMPPRVGDLISLRHNQGTHPAISAENCVGIEVENVTVHSCGAESLKFIHCENILVKGLNCVPNKKAGRKISAGRNAGINLCDCSGEVVVEGCTFHALQETPISLVSSCKTMLEVKNGVLTVQGSLGNCLSCTPYVRGSDKVNIIERNTLKTVHTITASRDSEFDGENWKIYTDEELPEALISAFPEDYVVENADRSASLTVRECHLGSCRSRGIIVTTPKKVLIEDNVFESAGSAILMGGDAIYWYGLGSCRDVTIRRNLFADVCTTARYHNSPAMITINPEIPKLVKGDWYHKNITISENTFFTPDTPVLYAYSVDGLFFENNKIIKSNRQGIHRDVNQLIFAKNVNNIRITSNMMIGQFGVEKTKFEYCTSVYTKGKKDDRS
jgi:hypothetical protein